MLSIGRILDEYDIAQEIRLERQLHKGAFLVLEGETDVKRFTAFVDEVECSLVNAYGRHNALAAIKMLHHEGLRGVLACVDADFDRLLGRLDSHQNVIYSAGHDLDLDWITSSTLQKYATEFADREKLGNLNDMDALRSKILLGLKPISVARLLNRTGKIKHKVNHVDAAKCFSGFEVNLSIYLKEVLHGKNVKPIELGTIENLIRQGVQNKIDLDQLSNGHDFCCALGASLRKEIGSKKDAQTWGKEVASHIRLAFSDADFKKTYIYGCIIKWESENNPYIILDRRLLF
jgi:hypothetical protein